MSLNFCHLKGILSYLNKPLGQGLNIIHTTLSLGERLSSTSLNSWCSTLYMVLTKESLLRFSTKLSCLKESIYSLVALPWCLVQMHVAGTACGHWLPPIPQSRAQSLHKSDAPCAPWTTHWLRALPSEATSLRALDKRCLRPL